MFWLLIFCWLFFVGCPGPRPVPTERVFVSVNLDPRVEFKSEFDPLRPKETSHFSTEVLVADLEGNLHKVRLFFRKTEPGVWIWHVLIQGNIESASGRLEFGSCGCLLKEETFYSRFRFKGNQRGFEIKFDFGQNVIEEQGEGLNGTTQFAVGFSADHDRKPPELPTQKVKIVSLLDPSKVVSRSFNPSLAEETADSSAEIIVVDSLREPHLLKVYFKWVSEGRWDYFVMKDKNGSKVLGQGMLLFNKYGALYEEKGNLISLNFGQEKVKEQRIELDFGTSIFKEGGDGYDGTHEVQTK